MTDTRFQADTGNDVRAVALAICKSRTCEGVSCCQWPANMGRTNCNAKIGAYDDAARAAIAVLSSEVAVAPPKYPTLQDWLNEVEGYGLRAERIPHGSYPWIVEAWNLGALAALPSEAAAVGPTNREQIARTIAKHMWCGATYDDATEAEKDAFVNAADAVLALSRPKHLTATDSGPKNKCAFCSASIFDPCTTQAKADRCELPPFCFDRVTGGQP